MGRSPMCPLSHSAWFLVKRPRYGATSVGTTHIASYFVPCLSSKTVNQPVWPGLVVLPGESACVLWALAALSRKSEHQTFFSILFQILIHVISAIPVFNQLQRSILAAASQLLNCSSSLVAQTIISCIIRYRAGHNHQHASIPQESTCSVS